MTYRSRTVESMTYFWWILVAGAKDWLAQDPVVLEPPWNTDRTALEHRTPSIHYYVVPPSHQHSWGTKPCRESWKGRRQHCGWSDPATACPGWTPLYPVPSPLQQPKRSTLQIRRSLETVIRSETWQSAGTEASLATCPVTDSRNVKGQRRLRRHYCQPRSQPASVSSRLASPRRRGSLAWGRAKHRMWPPRLAADWSWRRQLPRRSTAAAGDTSAWSEDAEQRSAAESWQSWWRERPVEQPGGAAALPAGGGCTRTPAVAAASAVSAVAVRDDAAEWWETVTEVSTRVPAGCVQPGQPTVAVVTSEPESTAELVEVKLTASTSTAETHSITPSITSHTVKQLTHRVSWPRLTFTASDRHYKLCCYYYYHDPWQPLRWLSGLQALTNWPYTLTFVCIRDVVCIRKHMHSVFRHLHDIDFPSFAQVNELHLSCEIF